MVDFNYFLNRKYALQEQAAAANQQNADANTLQVTAQAGNMDADARLTNARTGLLAGESAAQQALQRAQAGNLGADTRLTDTRATLMPGESAAQQALQRAQARLVTNQASVVIPESEADVTNLLATAEARRMDTRVLGNNNFTGVFGGTAGVASGRGGFLNPNARRPLFR